MSMSLRGYICFCGLEIVLRQLDAGYLPVWHSRHLLAVIVVVWFSNALSYQRVKCACGFSLLYLSDTKCACLGLSMLLLLLLHV